MGLTLWSDRWFAANEMDVSANNNQYKCGLSLTNISEVCREQGQPNSSHCSTTWEQNYVYFSADRYDDWHSVRRVYNDAQWKWCSRRFAHWNCFFENRLRFQRLNWINFELFILSAVMQVVLLIFKKDPVVDWLDKSIKQMHIFTDNPFHYHGDGTHYGNKGDHTPPLEKWLSQPNGLYRYYEPHTVSAFTRGCEWNTTIMQCGGQYRTEWERDKTKAHKTYESYAMIHPLWYGYVYSRKGSESNIF